MRDLVDDRDLGPPFEEPVEVHLFESDAAVLRHLAGHFGEPLYQCMGVGAAVRLDEPQHHVDAAPLERVRLLQHPVGLSDTGGEPDVELEPAALGAPEHLQ